MVRRIIAVLALLLSPAGVLAQQPPPPIPLYPGAAPPSIAPEPLPPVPPAPAGAITETPPAPPRRANLGPPAARVFCEQAITVRLADRDTVPERYRRFLGMFSDASWTPDLCAALIVETVTPDGTATIVYAFGPMGANGKGPAGVLHGTGIIRQGELKFQNSDGSQFAFRPLYTDLEGRLTTPQGQSYEAIFKKTL